MLKHDLNSSDFNPVDCPLWAKETVPDFIQQFRGRNGMPSPYYEKKAAIALSVRGIDRYHANQFIVYRKETADYLYSEYTSLNVNYFKGALPSFEKLAAKVIKGCKSDKEKAEALLIKGTKESMKHPRLPPFGEDVKGDRNLDDEALLLSGTGWCNEQARVFVRLCQVSGIPARIVQLFYSDKITGHCIAEFYADGHWCMADATYFCVFPGPDGKLLSAAQCHDKAEGQRSCGIEYGRRIKEIIKLAHELKAEPKENNPPWMKSSAEYNSGKLNCFGIINYPLPK